jgi:hypothetical protein
MLSEKLKGMSAATYVDYGYGQVEPNHLSARRTGQIYAQLPAAVSIEKLENGQFVKYDYANGEVNTTGAGEWMLVFNEIKLYRDGQVDAEFAMLKDDYFARVYSPYGTEVAKGQSRYYNGNQEFDHVASEKVTAKADRRADWNYTEDPFHIETISGVDKMPAGKTMVPRVFKTNVGDIFTTNMINATEEEAVLGKFLAPAADGILAPVADEAEGMKWQIVKVYTLPDRQKAVKIMRVA